MASSKKKNHISQNTAVDTNNISTADTDQETPEILEVAQEDNINTEKKQGSQTPAFPVRATVIAALAVLTRAAGLGTQEMLKPVATLKHGTKVTVRAIEGDSAQLANGLWTKAAYLDLGK